MDPKVKDLTLFFTDAELILRECKELIAYLALELQAARDDRKEQQKQFREFMSELWQTLRRIQAQNKIDATLLGLIEPKKGKAHGNRAQDKTKINARGRGSYNRGS